LRVSIGDGLHRGHENLPVAVPTVPFCRQQLPRPGPLQRPDPAGSTRTVGSPRQSVLKLWPSPLPRYCEVRRPSTGIGVPAGRRPSCQSGHSG
jgi:hypothetical protein